jgi:hypothetical protein
MRCTSKRSDEMHEQDTGGKTVSWVVSPATANSLRFLDAFFIAAMSGGSIAAYSAALGGPIGLWSAG